MNPDDIPHRELRIAWLEDPTQEVWCRHPQYKTWIKVIDPASFPWPTYWQIELRPAKRMVKIPEAVIPAPMTEAPKMGADFWEVDVAEGSGVWHRKWQNRETDHAILENNCAYATESDARAAFEAMTRRVEA